MTTGECNRKMYYMSSTATPFLKYKTNAVLIMIIFIEIVK
jgi:hypothetical protein